MSKSKKKIWLGISIVLVIILLLGSGIYFFMFGFKNTSEATINNKDSKIKLTFYDSNGNPISSSLSQSTVYSGTRSQSGIFYMSMKIFLTNTGTTMLTNVRRVPNSENQLSKALDGQNPVQSYLNIGQSNILFWDTANTCAVQGDCGSNELCIGTKCLINVENLAGNITFSTQILGDYLNAYGVTATNSLNTGLTLSFSTENVFFRTNVNQNLPYYNYQALFNPSLTFDGKLRWIAIDKNGDGILEKYGRSTSSSSANAYCENRGSDPVLLYMPFGCHHKCFGGANTDVWILGDSATETIWVCYNDDTSSSMSYNYKTTSEGTENAITYAIPLEPYKSTNCGGQIPCEERYVTQTSIPIQTCNDNYKNQDESDIDCGGTACSPCGYLKSCTQTSDCLVNMSCLGNLCMPDFYTKFRTTNNNYTNGAIGYTDSCGINLTRYGYYSSSSSLFGNCYSTMPADSACGDVSFPTNILLNIDFPKSDSSINYTLWRGETGNLCFCKDVGTLHVRILYKTDDPDANSISSSFLPTLPTDYTKEIFCNS